MPRQLTENESAIIEAALELAFLLEARHHGPIKPEKITRALATLKASCEILQQDCAPDGWRSL